jgi:hypothetical protein
MTRLLKDEKAELVSAVIDALPKGGYQEKITQRAATLAVMALPEAAKTLWKGGHPGLIVTRSIYWYEENQHRGYWTVANATVPGYEDQHERIKADPLILEWVRELIAEKNTRDTLRAQLRAGVEAIRTVEEFKVAFPDLVSYLPTKAEVVANLPVSSVINEAFVAAGLPVPKEVQEAA